MDKKEILRSIHSAVLSFRAHPDNTENSEFEGQVSQLSNVYNAIKESTDHLPEGFKVYECTDCQTVNVKKDNKEVHVGICDKCEHPLWN